MIPLAVVPNNENPSVCARCGGDCCKSAPGAYHPSDFGTTVAEVVRRVYRALVLGWAVVDKWDADSQSAWQTLSFVRPPTCNEKESNTNCVVHLGWGGRCSNLTPSGCCLPWDSRPWNCRALIPDPNPDPEEKHCKMPTSLNPKLSSALDWERVIGEDTMHQLCVRAARMREKCHARGLVGVNGR